MRAVRLLLIFLAALLSLGLLAAWQVPGRLDWNRYRGSIEALASASLGRPVTIAGPITLSLLPETELTAADVVVAASAPGDTPALTVKALRLRVAALPLLSGRVDARELALSGADLAIGWPLQRGELAGWPPSWLSAFSARIEKGRLRVGGLVLDGINATLQTTEAGGLLAVGTGRLGGQAIRLTARLTPSGSDGAAGLNLAVEALDRLAGVTGGFVGQLASDGGLAGRAEISGPNLSLLIPPPGPAPGGVAPGGVSPEGISSGEVLPVGAFKVASTVRASGETASFDDLTIDLAGSHGATALAGAATLRFTPELRLDARLSTARLELDPWVSRMARLDGSGLTIGLQLTAEAVSFGGGLMRKLAAELEATRSQISLRELSVQLPGDAELRLAGVVQRGDPARPSFDGNVRLAAPRLREMLRWLDGAGMQMLPELPEGVLKAIDFRAHAVVESGMLTLDRIEGRLDGTAVNGELRLRPALPATGAAGAQGNVAGNGGAIVASLELGSLRLDPWLPDLSQKLTHFSDAGGFDVDLRLRAPVARLRGQEIMALSLDVAAGPTPAGGTGRVTLRQLEATVRGVHLIASGSVAEGGRLTEGKLRASTDDASSLADLIPPAWRPEFGAFWRGPAVLNGQMAGPMEALGLKLTLDMADARLEAQPVIDLPARKWAGSVTLRHPGAARLLAMLGVGGAEAWLGEGSLSVIADLAGEPRPNGPSFIGPGFGAGRVTAELRDLTAGQLRLSAPLVLDLTGDVPTVSGRIQADTLALPEPAWRDGTPLPFALLRGWRASVPVTARQVLVGRVPMLTQASGTKVLADGVLRLDPFTATLAGGTLTGTLAVTAGAEPPSLAVTAALTDALAGGPVDAADPGILPLDLLAGQVNAALDVSAVGHSPAAMLATLSGGAKLNVTDGVLGGFDLFRATRAVASADPRTRLATEAALRVAMAEGVTNFERLEIRAEAQSGIWVLRHGSLSGNAGTAEFSGSVGLGARLLDLRVAMHPAIESPPEIAIRLTGPWEKPRRSTELAGFLRWLADRKPPPP